jgi:PAS domain S-box-containing protein
VLVAINVGISAWTIYNFGRLMQSLDMLQGESYQNVIAVQDMARAVENHSLAIADMLNRDVNNGKIAFLQAKDKFNSAYAVCARNKNNPDAALILENVGSTYEGYLIVMDTLLSYVKAKDFATAKAFHYNIISPFLLRLSDDCLWLTEENQKQMLEVSRHTKSIASDATAAIITTLFLAVLFSILTMIQFTRRIIKPAENLTQTVHQIGRGRLDLKIDVQSRDEIGELSREFNKMTERLRRFEAMNIEKILVEKQKSETIVGKINDVIIVCDASGIVSLINPAAEALLQIKESEAVGKRLSDLIANERIEEVFADPERQPSKEQPYLQLSAGGVEKYFQMQVSLIRAREGGIDGVVLFLSDVTGFKELDRQKSDFMAMVSHEFRTPLTSINIGVDILRQHLLGPLTQGQEELLESFKQDCSRLTKLVRELLQISKLESGKLVQAEEAVDLRKVVDSSLEPYRLQFKEKGVVLTVSMDQALPLLMADEQHLSWVVSNLISNALRYTPSGGKVEVCATVDRGSIVLKVLDTGEGIPPEYLDKIFDKFVQVKQMFNLTPGSVGLGLSIAKDIVEMYDGKISVESELHKGSSFTVRLPVARQTGS